ncbi:adhesion G-protein coupled receptor F3 [Cyprinodon tularosa]|uniref:adhesion G-protein coupled receptor F3 n=1 Tax=Cyprinodon tularosa TaxID=77115 RepID=UPI0018E27A28|nr:adhesion G-protein coupled receptor F3 [Cyprinodon tularosa]
MKNRSKMRIFMFLIMVTLSINQAAEAARSTQMYYAKMTIDKSALKYITGKLNFSVSDDKLNIEDVKITTECSTQNDTSNKSCKCREGHRWSDEACQKEHCCGQDACVLPMKAFYSEIRGFDSLKIEGFSIGSIVTNFAMKIVSGNVSQRLFEQSKMLSKNLSAEMILETTGVVNLILPSQPVKYNTTTKIQCTTLEDLNAEPNWNLKRDGKEFLITNGRISTLTKEAKHSSIELKTTDELWEGEYICLFEQHINKTIIKNKASAPLDVCLLPKIEISAEPRFPRCTTSEDIFYVNVKCKIKKTTENYAVEWTEGVSPNDHTDDGQTLTYQAQKVVNCKENSNGSGSPAVSCTMKNICNQSQTRDMKIEVIYVNDPFCAPEGDWSRTKADFTAELKCSEKAGKRKRKCSLNNGVATWDEEVSECIEEDLNNVLEKARISDIGLGVLKENAAEVLHEFETITTTSKLPGYANLEASVDVISTIEDKLQGENQMNRTSIEDFIISSSHLLNKSLESSWNATPPENKSSTVAETYMIAVEKFIKRSNITNIPKENLIVDVCNKSAETCSVSSFDVTISISNAGEVKTATFRNLQNYLPYNKNESEPNSIVVSATAENKSIDHITIEFKLINPRPRNVELKCVFWDTKLKGWSTDGCEWLGPFKESSCVCKHLSSFSILMSKKPLDVPGLTYVTYAALSVSVLSLIINLAIEFIVWSDVVKTSTSYLRHTAHVNISLCLLIADLCFLASSQPKGISDLWCRTSVVLKHFCFLAMFFWMFCLSATLLHRAVFLFHKVSKKNYLRFSLLIGYVCPLLIVFITFLTNNGGAEGMYYSKDSCWLVYAGLFKGSIFTFIIPVGVIVFINIFSMLVVIMKLISHHAEISKKTDISAEEEKAAAKTVLRTVVLLTPIFGVTWIFGFAMLALDLTSGDIAYAVNYIFNLLNGFQGFFILLTTCLGDKMTREALQRYLKKPQSPESSVSESSTKLESTVKK